MNKNILRNTAATLQPFFDVALGSYGYQPAVQVNIPLTSSMGLGFTLYSPEVSQFLNDCFRTFFSDCLYSRRKANKTHQNASLRFEAARQEAQIAAAELQKELAAINLQLMEEALFASLTTSRLEVPDTGKADSALAALWSELTELTANGDGRGAAWRPFLNRLEVLTTELDATRIDALKVLITMEVSLQLADLQVQGLTGTFDLPRIREVAEDRRKLVRTLQVEDIAPFSQEAARLKEAAFQIRQHQLETSFLVQPIWMSASPAAEDLGESWRAASFGLDHPLAARFQLFSEAIPTVYYWPTLVPSYFAGPATAFDWAATKRPALPIYERWDELTLDASNSEYEQKIAVAHETLEAIRQQHRAHFSAAIDALDRRVATKLREANNISSPLPLSRTNAVSGLALSSLDIDQRVSSLVAMGRLTPEAARVLRGELIELPSWISRAASELAAAEPALPVVALLLAQTLDAGRMFIQGVGQGLYGQVVGIAQLVHLAGTNLPALASAMVALIERVGDPYGIVLDLLKWGEDGLEAFLAANDQEKFRLVGQFIGEFGIPLATILKAVKPGVNAVIKMSATLSQNATLASRYTPHLSRAFADSQVFAHAAVEASEVARAFQLYGKSKIMRVGSFMEDAMLGRPLPAGLPLEPNKLNQVVESFLGFRYGEMQPVVGEVLYRIGKNVNNAGKVTGEWWSRLDPRSQIAAMSELALLPGWSFDFSDVSRLTIKESVDWLMIEGLAGTQGGRRMMVWVVDPENPTKLIAKELNSAVSSFFAGSGNQIYIPDSVRADPRFIQWIEDL